MNIRGKTRILGFTGGKAFVPSQASCATPRPRCSRPPRAPCCPGAGWNSWPGCWGGKTPWGWCPSPPAKTKTRPGSEHSFGLWENNWQDLRKRKGQTQRSHLNLLNCLKMVQAKCSFFSSSLSLNVKWCRVNPSCSLLQRCKICSH